MDRHLQTKIERLEAHVRELQTNRGPRYVRLASGGAGGAEIRRMQVTGAAPGGNQQLLTCKDWDGTTLGSREYIVRRVIAHLSGAELYAYKPRGKTDQTHDGEPVKWMALLALPPAEEGKVLMSIAGSWGADYLHFT